MLPLRVGVLASHGGTTLQAIIDACSAGSIDADVALVISNNSQSGALERARNANIRAAHISSVTHRGDVDAAICKELVGADVALVVLAGYMRRLGPTTLATYSGNVINVHPALLPKHGGTGMYGAAVHEAVIAAGDETSGATVHLVDERYDSGTTLAQVEVPVLKTDTADELAERVRIAEKDLLVETIGNIASGKLVPKNLT